MLYVARRAERGLGQIRLRVESTASTLMPLEAAAIASCIASVVFPTPPFMLIKLTTVALVRFLSLTVHTDAMNTTSSPALWQSKHRFEKEDHDEFTSILRRPQILRSANRSPHDWPRWALLRGWKMDMVLALVLAFFPSVWTSNRLAPIRQTISAPPARGAAPPPMRRLAETTPAPKAYSAP